ncbi:MAG TPA: ATP-binding cassette domain-containing protein [Clostridia bacterium]|nr:ATP-binding cassette domain-containing protein [Clostridia bacterium]
MINISAKKIYGENVVLNIPDFTFTKGKKYALIGANGSGKSTLIKCLAGIIDFEGKVNGNIKDVVYMPQKSYAFDLSVKNNVLLSFPFKDRKKHIKSVDVVLEKLDLTSLKNKNASRLSGGETQKVSLARVMVATHDVLLLDEPTSAMDIKAAQNAEKELISYVKDNNSTLIFATHSLRQASLADEIIFLKKGKIVEMGASSIMLNNPNNNETKEFIDFFR